MRYAITAHFGDDLALESFTAAEAPNLAWFAVKALIEAVMENGYGRDDMSIRIEYIDHEDVTHEFHMYQTYPNGHEDEDAEVDWDADIDGNAVWVGSRWDEYLSNWL